MSGAVGAVAKPQLRRLLQTQIKRNLVIAVVSAGLAALAQKVIVNDSRKSKYAAFYKDYDPEKEFERMKNKGLFDSCEPDE